MKFLLLFLLGLFSFKSYAQTIDHIVFEYDAAGNQVKRFVIDINPGKSGDVKDVEALVANDLTPSDIYDDVMYYPNPVKELLFVQWRNTSGESVNTIEVYNLNAQLVKQLKGISTNNSQIDFSNLPQGLYTVALMYSNGNKKTLKIIKH